MVLLKRNHYKTQTSDFDTHYVRCPMDNKGTFCEYLIYD